MHYYHGTKHKGHHQEFTLAYNTPEKDKFLESVLAAVVNETPISIEIGVTKVSKKDHYTKRVGREEAGKRIQPQEFQLNRIFQADSTRVTLYNKKMDLMLNFSVSKDKSKVFLMYATVNY